MTVSVGRDVVILACAVSAGVHGALTPSRWAESAATGAGFGAASVLLAFIAVALTRRPPTVRVAGAGTATFAGLIVTYGLAITTGVPLLQPEPEAVTALPIATKAIELLGLFAAADLLAQRTRSRAGLAPARSAIHPDRAARPLPLALTILVATFSGLVALATAQGHHDFSHGQAADHATAPAAGRASGSVPE